MRILRSEVREVDEKPHVRVDITLNRQQDTPDVWRHEGSAALVLVYRAEGDLAGSFRGDTEAFAQLVAQGVAMAFQAGREPQVFEALAPMLMRMQEEESDG